MESIASYELLQNAAELLSWFFTLVAVAMSYLFAWRI